MSSYFAICAKIWFTANSMSIGLIQMCLLFLLFVPSNDGYLPFGGTAQEILRWKVCTIRRSWPFDLWPLCWPGCSLLVSCSGVLLGLTVLLPCLSVFFFSVKKNILRQQLIHIMGWGGNFGREWVSCNLK